MVSETTYSNSIHYHTQNGRTLVYNIKNASDYGITLSPILSETETLVTETFHAEEHVLARPETSQIIPRKLCHQLPSIEERMRNCLHSSSEVINSYLSDSKELLQSTPMPCNDHDQASPKSYSDFYFHDYCDDDQDFNDLSSLSDGVNPSFAVIEDFAKVLEETSSVFEEVDCDSFDDQWSISDDKVRRIVGIVKRHHENVLWDPEKVSSSEVIECAHPTVHYAEEMCPDGYMEEFLSDKISFDHELQLPSIFNSRSSSTPTSVDPLSSISRNSSGRTSPCHETSGGSVLVTMIQDYVKMVMDVSLALSQSNQSEAPEGSLSEFSPVSNVVEQEEEARYTPKEEIESVGNGNTFDNGCLGTNKINVQSDSEDHENSSSSERHSTEEHYAGQSKNMEINNFPESHEIDEKEVDSDEDLKLGPIGPRKSSVEKWESATLRAERLISGENLEQNASQTTEPISNGSLTKNFTEEHKITSFPLAPKSHSSSPTEFFLGVTVAEPSMTEIESSLESPEQNSVANTVNAKEYPGTKSDVKTVKSLHSPLPVQSEVGEFHDSDHLSNGKELEENKYLGDSTPRNPSSASEVIDSNNFRVEESEEGPHIVFHQNMSETVYADSSIGSDGFCEDSGRGESCEQERNGSGYESDSCEQPLEIEGGYVAQGDKGFPVEQLKNHDEYIARTNSNDVVPCNHNESSQINFLKESDNESDEVVCFDPENFPVVEGDETSTYQNGQMKSEQFPTENPSLVVPTLSPLIEVNSGINAQNESATENMLKPVDGGQFNELWESNWTQEDEKCSLVESEMDSIIHYSPLLETDTGKKCGDATPNFLAEEDQDSEHRATRLDLNDTPLEVYTNHAQIENSLNAHDQENQDESVSASSDEHQVQSHKTVFGEAIVAELEESTELEHSNSVESENEQGTEMQEVMAEGERSFAVDEAAVMKTADDVLEQCLDVLEILEHLTETVSNSSEFEDMCWDKTLAEDTLPNVIGIPLAPEKENENRTVSENSTIHNGTTIEDCQLKKMEASLMEEFDRKNRADKEFQRSWSGGNSQCSRNFKIERDPFSKLCEELMLQPAAPEIVSSDIMDAIISVVCVVEVVETMMEEVVKLFESVSHTSVSGLESRENSFLKEDQGSCAFERENWAEEEIFVGKSEQDQSQIVQECVASIVSVVEVVEFLLETASSINLECQQHQPESFPNSENVSDPMNSEEESLATHAHKEATTDTEESQTMKTCEVDSIPLNLAQQCGIELQHQLQQPDLPLSDTNEETEQTTSTFDHILSVVEVVEGLLNEVMNAQNLETPPTETKSEPRPSEVSVEELFLRNNDGNEDSFLEKDVYEEDKLVQMEIAEDVYESKQPLWYKESQNSSDAEECMQNAREEVDTPCSLQPPLQNCEIFLNSVQRDTEHKPEQTTENPEVYESSEPSSNQSHIDDHGSFNEKLDDTNFYSMTGNVDVKLCQNLASICEQSYGSTEIFDESIRVSPETEDSIFDYVEQLVDNQLFIAMTAASDFIDASKSDGEIARGDFHQDQEPSFSFVEETAQNSLSINNTCDNDFCEKGQSFLNFEKSYTCFDEIADDNQNFEIALSEPQHLGPCSSSENRLLQFETPETLDHEVLKEAPILSVSLHEISDYTLSQEHSDIFTASRSLVSEFSDEGSDDDDQCIDNTSNITDTCQQLQLERARPTQSPNFLDDSISSGLDLIPEPSDCSLCVDLGDSVPTNSSQKLPLETSSPESSLKSLEQPTTSSVLKEVSHFLTTAAVAALVYMSPSESSSAPFNTDIIEEASKYISSQPEPKEGGQS